MIGAMFKHYYYEVINLDKQEKIQKKEIDKHMKITIETKKHKFI